MGLGPEMGRSSACGLMGELKASFLWEKWMREMSSRSVQGQSAFRRHGPVALVAFAEVPPQMMELVAGLGEVWSAQTLSAYLNTTGARSEPWLRACRSRY